MGGIAQQRHPALGPVLDRLAVAQNPAPPLGWNFQELARLVHDVAEAGEDFLAVSRLVDADALHLGLERRDEVERLPALQWVMHHVALGPGPKRRRVPPQILGHLLDRQHRAIGDVAGQSQRIAAGKLLTDFRADAVAADDRVGFEHRTVFGADLRAGGRVLIADDALLVDERDAAVRAAGIEQHTMQVGAMDDGVGIAEAPAERFVDREFPRSPRRSCHPS